MRNAIRELSLHSIAYKTTITMQAQITQLKILVVANSWIKIAFISKMYVHLRELLDMLVISSFSHRVSNLTFSVDDLHFIQAQLFYYF